MSTKIIGSFDIVKNNFSLAGRQKNKLYKQLKECYAGEIRERTKGKFSYIQGYYKYFNNYPIAIYRVANDGSYVEKTHNRDFRLIPQNDETIDKVIHTYIKTSFDRLGNIINSVEKQIIYINGKFAK
ncbi:MAG: hypothetical protein WCY19_04900 [Candidatus Gastranaerophilaceae bacterium]